MSTQSGIQASSELLDTFKDFCSANDRTILLYIDPDSEQVQAAHRLSGSEDYVADFNAIATHLDPKEPRYIIHKLQDPSRHAFISYVPDGAHVRKKMLYASSANTIQRQLGGSERFPHTVFWTDVSEVSADGWKEHQNHTSAAHPITSEEAAERDAADELLLSGDSASTSARRSHVESRRSTPLAAEQPGDVLDTAFTQLSVPSGTPWARVLRINDGEKVYVHSEHDGAHNVVELIDSTAPQYTLVDHDGSGKVHFVYTCPSGSSLRQKMLYSFKKEPTARALRSLIDISNVTEATDPNEVPDLLKPATERTSASSGATNARFARPKRPGRR